MPSGNSLVVFHFTWQYSFEHFLQDRPGLTWVSLGLTNFQCINFSFTFETSFLLAGIIIFFLLLTLWKSWPTAFFHPKFLIRSLPKLLLKIPVCNNSLFSYCFLFICLTSSSSSVSSFSIFKTIILVFFL